MRQSWLHLSTCRSAVFWIRYRDVEGQYQSLSSGIAKALPGARKKAKIMAGRHTIKELFAPKIGDGKLGHLPV